MDPSDMNRKQQTNVVQFPNAQPMTVPCPHCSQPNNDRNEGDGNCHNGIWSGSTGYYLSCSNCQNKFNANRGFFSKEWMVPCRFCEGLKVVILTADGKVIPYQI